MKRSNCLIEIKKQKDWDLVVIGGGASGLGVALDAISRGLSVILIEKADFAKGTSSRSTKLLHGGVRYLAQGDIALVYEALKERGLMMKNAPHVSGKQSFIIPIYSFLDKLKYRLGLKIYDLMAGRLRIGKSIWISKDEVVKKISSIKSKGLQGGVVYYDGQFDDARLAVNLAQTCTDLGGCILNYMGVIDLTKNKDGFITGVVVEDQLDGSSYEIRAKAVVNATGVFADNILRMDNPNISKSIRPSQGAHLVLDISFLGGEDALMIPETSDGRVLFGIPWHGKLLVGTTDTLRDEPKLEPKALTEEIDFILETCAAYLTPSPKREDVLAVFAGLRPLAVPKEMGAPTKEISRSHKIFVTASNLVSLIGGKWTTFRRMGQDTIDVLAELNLVKVSKSSSEDIKIHGFPNGKAKDGHWAIYGNDAGDIQDLLTEQPALGMKLHPNYPNTKAEVVWMVRNEMAMKVEDILARRMRILFMDARAAIQMAPQVAKIMRTELNTNEEWEKNEMSEFNKMAKQYLITS